MLIGHLGKDPEYMTFENGNTLAKCSLATSESYKDKEGKLHTQTEWHSLIVWKSLADFAHQYLKKGMLVYVEGKLKTRSFDNKDQDRRYVTEVVVEKINLLEKGKAQGLPGMVSEDTYNGGGVENDNNLPF